MQRHDTDVVSLVVGLLFLGIAAAWGMARIDLIDPRDLRLAIPIGLVAVGIAGLTASLRRNRTTPVASEEGVATTHDPSDAG